MRRIAVTTLFSRDFFKSKSAASITGAGFEVVLFDDGMAMEAAVLAGEIAGVLDTNLNEIIDGRHPNRLTAAGLTKIPQVIVPCGFDHLPDKTLDRLGKEIAEKASAAGGPTRIIVNADIPRVLRESIANWIYPPGLVVEAGDQTVLNMAIATLLKLVKN